MFISFYLSDEQLSLLFLLFFERVFLLLLFDLNLFPVNYKGPSFFSMLWIRLAESASVSFNEQIPTSYLCMTTIRFLLPLHITSGIYYFRSVFGKWYGCFMLWKSENGFCLLIKIYTFPPIFTPFCKFPIFTGFDTAVKSLWAKACNFLGEVKAEGRLKILSVSYFFSVASVFLLKHLLNFRPETGLDSLF